MHYIKFLLCLSITLITVKEGQATTCSGVKKTSRNIFPLLWLQSENPIDEALLTTELSVRSTFPEIRIFILSCMAPYPISFAISSDFKNGEREHPSQVEMDAATRYHAGEDFIVSTQIVVSPQEEFRLKASCIPICDLAKFPSAVDVHTEVDNLKKLSKLLVHNVSWVKSLDNSKSEDGNQSQIERLIFVAIFIRLVTISLLTYILNFMLTRDGFWNLAYF